MRKRGVGLQWSPHTHSPAPAWGWCPRAWACWWAGWGEGTRREGGESGSQAGTMLASSQATEERGGKGENAGRRKGKEKKGDRAGESAPPGATPSSPSWSLKPLEERSLSSGFSPPSELKLQQEAMQSALSKDFPGGTGTQGRSWEGGFPPSLVSPGTRLGCSTCSCPETGCQTG